MQFDERVFSWGAKGRSTQQHRLYGTQPSHKALSEAKFWKQGAYENQRRALLADMSPVPASGKTKAELEASPSSTLSCEVVVWNRMRKVVAYSAKEDTVKAAEVYYLENDESAVEDVWSTDVGKIIVNSCAPAIFYGPGALTRFNSLRARHTAFATWNVADMQVFATHEDALFTDKKRGGMRRLDLVLVTPGPITPGYPPFICLQVPWRLVLLRTAMDLAMADVKLPAPPATATLFVVPACGRTAAATVDIVCDLVVNLQGFAVHYKNTSSLSNAAMQNSMQEALVLMEGHKQPDWDAEKALIAEGSPITAKALKAIDSNYEQYVKEEDRALKKEKAKLMKEKAVTNAKAKAASAKADDKRYLDDLIAQPFPVPDDKKRPPTQPVAKTPIKKAKKGGRDQEGTGSPAVDLTKVDVRQQENLLLAVTKPKGQRTRAQGLAKPRSPAAALSSSSSTSASAAPDADNPPGGAPSAEELASLFDDNGL